MARHRSGYIRLDVSEFLDEIDDDALLEECQSRKLNPAAPGETVDLEIVREAYDALMRHSVGETRSILERLLFPKWKSVAACKSQLEKML